MGEQPGEALQRWLRASPEEREELGQIKRARMETAWKMHTRGDSYGKIGLELGVKPQTARHYVQKMAEEIWEFEQADTRHQRSIEVTRLEELVSDLLARVRNGDDDALDRYLKVVQLKARLMGLYAPVRVQMTHTVKRPAEKEDREKLDQRIFELYKRLERRGQPVGAALKKWVDEHIVEGELVKAEPGTQEEPSRSENPPDE